VEFAVALPLLVVFVVGIFDFSGAYTLKQKLTNIARDAARSAAAGPASDLSSPSLAVPSSVIDAFQLVDQYLVANKINDCGITAAGVNTAPEGWTFTGTANGCLGRGLVIIVNRGYTFPATGAITPADVTCTAQAVGARTAVIATCVSIQYAYQWQFGRVVSLLGSAATLPTAITATAVAMNEN
jgi:Flp pilus assembly protein TadG